MKVIKKKISKVILSLSMVFAMAFSIMPTNVFAATYPEPDITVNYAENMEAIEIAADKSTTIKVVFDKTYRNIHTVEQPFGGTSFDERGVDYAIITFSPVLSDLGTKEVYIVLNTAVDQNETINFNIKVIPFKTDKEKVVEAKPLAETAIGNVIATNSTTAGNTLDAVTASISSVDGVTASWKADSPTITPATQENAGSITGTIVLTCGTETVEVKVNKTIEKLSTPTPETPSRPTTGIEGEGEETGKNIKVITKIPSEVKDVIDNKYIIGAIELSKAKEPVKVTVEVDKRKKVKEIYVLQANPETGAIELLTKSEVDKNGKAEFTTDSKELLHLMVKSSVAQNKTSRDTIQLDFLQRLAK